MGVPSLFRSLLKDHPELYSKQGPSQCAAFFLDFNCLIHHASRLANTSDDEQVITHVVAYTRTLVNTIVKPTHMVYIAMDGPVPCSKMIRQRERRFKKVKDDAFLNVDTTNRFDSNKITPGTLFMNKLSVRLQNIISLGVLKVPTVLFSDSSVAGEGEWKIYNYIRAHKETSCIVVYGLDADLIVWSMACNRLDVVLCRENEENSIMFFNLETSLIYVFRKYGLYEKFMQNPYAVLLDVVMVLMLGGNDFVSPIECVKIRDHGWDALLSTYAEMHLQITCPVTLMVNWDALYAFMKYMATFEDNLSKQKYKRQLCRAQHQLNDTEDEEAVYFHTPFAHTKHPLHHMYGKQSLSIPFMEPFEVWKTAYYERIFGTPHTIPGFMSTLCRDYLASIVWCWEYYTKPIIPSWSFAYDHIAAPCLTDVVVWFSRVVQAAYELAFVDVLQGQSLTPVEQLVCVLPMTSAHLLPQPIQTSLFIDTNPLLETYVHDFILEPITGQKMIYSNPILPPLDIVSIQKTVQCISQYFEEDEVVVNTLRIHPFMYTT